MTPEPIQNFCRESYLLVGHSLVPTIDMGDNIHIFCKVLRWNTKLIAKGHIEKFKLGYDPTNYILTNVKISGRNLATIMKGLGLTCS